MEYLKEIEKVKVEEIEKVATGMKNGKVAIFPTETVYGIGTNAFDEIACKKIYDMKKRTEDKPLIVLISDMDMLYQVIESINDLERQLIQKFWPGPLTIIFEKKHDGRIADSVTSGKNSVGVRMTDGKIANLLIQKAGVPIVAPSANLSGMPTGTKMEKILQELGNQVDYIVDCGDIEDETTSTIVKVEGKMIHILRQGKISKEELEQIAEVK